MSPPFLYGIRLSKLCKNPQAEAWGYTDKARLRWLKSKATFELLIWYCYLVKVRSNDFSRYLVKVRSNDFSRYLVKVRSNDFSRFLIVIAVHGFMGDRSYKECVRGA